MIYAYGMETIKQQAETVALYRLSGCGISVILAKTSPRLEYYVQRILAHGGVPDVQLWCKGGDR